MNASALLRDARRSRGLTQAQLARRSATTQNYVSRIERGAVEPTLPTVERLLHAMGLRLAAEVEPLGCGNEEPRRLRAEYAGSTPEQRVDEAMTLSEFVTSVASEGAAR